MKILVTGAAGFIGSHVVDKLIRKHSAQVIAIDDLSNGFREDVNQRAKFKIMSLRNVDKMVSFLRGCDAVIHCSETGNHWMDMENTDLLLRAMRSAEVRRIINLSSGEVYGTGQFGMYPVSEDVVTLSSPTTLRGVGKLTQELLCNQFAQEIEDRHAVSLRVGLPLGPRASCQDPVNDIIRSFALNEKEKTFPYGEREEYDFIHVYDVRDLILATLFHIDLFTADVFNAGSGKSSSLREIAFYIEGLFGASSYQFHPTSQEHKATRLNMHKAARELSFIPRRSISDAITDELAWLKSGNNLERWGRTNAAGR